MSDPYAQQPLVYSFGQGRADGSSAMKELLGGKGAGLAEMTMLGIPVPPGFTISTDACRAYLQEGREPDSMAEEISKHLLSLEGAIGRRLGAVDECPQPLWGWRAWQT